MNICPKISIVTPSYNQGEYLEECIDSILSQHYPNLEYIIMDGGSTDNSVEVIKRYEKYLTYWQSKPDSGQYAAINEGFNKTSGEIMAWLNSDDKYHANALFMAAYVFAGHSEIEWLTGRHTCWDKDGQLIGLSASLMTYSREQFLKMRNDVPWMQQESTFWRRLLWERAGGYVRSDLGYAGDFELWVRFSRYARIYTVNALLGGYRSHGNQKAVNSMDRYLEEVEAVVREEASVVTNEGAGTISNAASPVEIDYAAMRDFYNELLPPGQRPNFSSHQTYSFLQREKDSLEIVTSRLRTELEELSDRLMLAEKLTQTLSWRMTAPMRKVLDLFKKL